MDSKKTVMILGGGGREHALAWKLRQSVHVGKIIVAPGNAGTQQLPNTINLPIDSADVAAVVDTATKNKVDLVVVGPEKPLVNGVTDALIENHITVFGPTKKAAILESSKAWTVEFMKRAGIPHPRSAIFTDFQRAVDALPKLAEAYASKGFVIKADGLAEGKGVVVCKNISDAQHALHLMMIEKKFGSAGEQVVIQEKLVGFEASIEAIADGTHYRLLPTAKDHKTIFDNNLGPMTGGMGVVSPHPQLTHNQILEIEQRIIAPAIFQMHTEGTPFTGVLYAGLMVTNEGIFVLEFNVRFGDAETEALMPLLDADLYELLASAARGDLKQNGTVLMKNAASSVVVLAAPGYPGVYQKGIQIHGLEKYAQEDGTIVFHAGTKQDKNSVVTSGGRVLMLTSVGPTLADACQNVYTMINSKKIYFDGMQYRSDIGKH